MPRYFVYYRVPAVHLAAVASRLQALQPPGQGSGATVELLRRTDTATGAAGAACTLMEVYEADTDTARAYEARAGQALAPWLDGLRHVECFEPLR